MFIREVRDNSFETLTLIKARKRISSQTYRYCSPINETRLRKSINSRRKATCWKSFGQILIQSNSNVMMALWTFGMIHSLITWQVDPDREPDLVDAVRNVLAQEFGLSVRLRIECFIGDKFGLVPSRSK